MEIVKRLRDVGCDREPFTPDHAHCICRLANEAADELDRLRADLALPRTRSVGTADWIAQMKKSGMRLVPT